MVWFHFKGQKARLRTPPVLPWNSTRTPTVLELFFGVHGVLLSPFVSFTSERECAIVFENVEYTMNKNLDVRIIFYLNSHKLFIFRS